MARDPIPTWYFALVVVRLGRRFLLVQEKKYGESWSIPGGRVEPGETIADAAIREVYEESGIPITLDGIYRVEQTVGDHVRMRVLFAGTPRGDVDPKTTADDESLGAAWLTLEEIRELRLRGPELGPFLETIAIGQQAVYPLALLDRELAI